MKKTIKNILKEAKKNNSNVIIIIEQKKKKNKKKKNKEQKHLYPELQGDIVLDSDLE